MIVYFHLLLMITQMFMIVIFMFSCYHLDVLQTNINQNIGELRDKYLDLRKWSVDTKEMIQLLKDKKGESNGH